MGKEVHSYIDVITWEKGGRGEGGGRKGGGGGGEREEGGRSSNYST